MRVGVIQSCYLPWRGYFDFIASVDLFVIYDDVQYSTGSWRNRNRLKTDLGLRWITVPVSVTGKPTIDEVPIASPRKPWRNQHCEAIKESLRTAPFFTEAYDIWAACTSVDTQFLSPLNVQLIRAVCEYLKINTPLINARDYRLSGSGTERLIDLLQQLGATAYLSGPSAKDYLDEEQFRQHGIGLEYKSYNYAQYHQLWGDFVDGVTILDLIANTGPDAVNFLRSRTSDVVAVA